MMRQVMTKAVAIARTLEGDWVARMKMALKMAWAIIKNESKKTMEDIAEIIKSKLNGVQVNVWERYGKRRIYINKGYKNTVAMLEFDQDDNYIGDYRELGPMDLMAAGQNGVEDEIIAINEIKKELVA